MWRGGEKVTRRFAKPPSEGSSPSRASIYVDGPPGLLQVLVLSQVFDPTQPIASHLEALTDVSIEPGDKAPPGGPKSS